MKAWNEIFKQLISIFGISGEIKSVEVVSNGHINTTYDVTVNADGENRRYIFQKLNIFVFREPEKIMENIDRVTNYISEKLEATGKDRNGVMHFLHTADGKNHFSQEDGFWRISEYVENTVTLNSCEDLGALRSAGYAFGSFQVMLSDFDASLLHETIPNFHNTRMRFATLFSHVEEDPCGRVSSVRKEIDALRSMQERATYLCDLVDSGMLPLRVTHNDTKINNVLFDKETKKAKTVIDLDTVMPGLVSHDFGDAIRFAANYAAEDEKDLSLVGLDIERFRAFAEGFVRKVAGIITPTEKETMALGAFVMTAECAARFLDDYITGDHYFKTHYEGQNLVRARCQIKLAQDMLSRMDEMNAIIEQIASSATK